MSSINLIAFLRAKEGQGDALANVLIELAAAVRAAEEGNLRYDISRDGDTIAVYEVYKDKAALDTHTNSEHYKRLGKKLAEFIDGKPELRFFTPITKL